MRSVKEHAEEVWRSLHSIEPKDWYNPLDTRAVTILKLALEKARADGVTEMREKFSSCFETWIDLNESMWVTLPKGLRAALLDSFIDVLKSTQEEKP